MREMAELLSLDLVAKGAVTDKFTLTVGYDHSNVSAAYRGDVASDYLGRKIPRHAHGTVTLPKKSSSTREITRAYMTLFEEIIDTGLTVRRINLTAQDTVPVALARRMPEQLSMLDTAEESDARAHEEERESRERRVQSAILDIKARFGKNAIIKGMNLEEGGTTVARNSQIGGHRA